MTWLTSIWRSLWEVWAFRHEPEHYRRLADLYWGALLFLAFAVIVGASAYGVMKFLEATQGDEEALAASGGGLPPLNKKDLQATLDGFAARAAAYEAFKTSPPTIADPSR